MPASDELYADYPCRREHGSQFPHRMPSALPAEEFQLSLAGTRLPLVVPPLARLGLSHLAAGTLPLELLGARSKGAGEENPIAPPLIQRHAEASRSVHSGAGHDFPGHLAHGPLELLRVLP